MFFFGFVLNILKVSFKSTTPWQKETNKCDQRSLFPNKYSDSFKEMNHESWIGLRAVEVNDDKSWVNFP